jgi:hypothetical protein
MSIVTGESPKILPGGLMDGSDSYIGIGTIEPGKNNLNRKPALGKKYASRGFVTC